MSTKDSKAQPIPVPKEPPEMIARRGKILAELEKQSKTATGNIKACMLKSVQVLKAMEPSAPLDEHLYRDFTEAFMRLTKDPAALPPPEIFLLTIEYMQERIAALSPQFTSSSAEHGIKAPAITAAAAPAAAAPAAAPAAPQAPAGKAAKDGFESGGQPKKKMSLGGDDAPPPASSSSESKKQEELESFKTWMKNPGLGKMKG
ncbi:MAG: hypothetical protein ACJ8AT_37885 [Hyalangium sp.]|uniref:hypothetical protein n=1 Tax=Hyalangium sp. TaxID=2028555 RepID=UPI00389AC899